MSYIKINIGGRERGLKFSQGTNILLQDKLAEMDDLDRKAFGVQYIIWAGLKTNCAIKGQRFTKDLTDIPEGAASEVPATVEDVFEWVEKLPQDVIIDIVNLYAEVNAPVPKNEEVEGEDVEKKSITEATPPSATGSDVVS